MAAKYTTFGSYVLFKEILQCELGHLYRAGRLGKDAVEATVWLLVFDAKGMPGGELASASGTVQQIDALLKAGNVATGVRVEVENGVPALAWDYLPGRPLAQVFSRVHEEGFPIPVDNALLILEKLSLALSAALAVDMGGSSLVHGFLHPALVTVTNDGEAVVAGLGLGTALLESLDDPAIREQAAPYLAPEVLTSRAPTRRSDVYSLGAILYQLMTGSPLPADPAKREEAIASAHLAYEEEPVPQDIMAVLTRALADRPEGRFSSAADFKKELDKLLYGGAYSPTTFNLALFMDRLFRNDIELEEKERAEEQSIDVSEYLEAKPEPVVMPDAGEIEPVTGVPQEKSGGGKGLWIGLAAVIVAAAAAGIFFLSGRFSGPPPVPTPTAEQLAAQKAAQQKQVEALVQQQVNELMKQREDEIRKELMSRQAEIDKLQKKYKELQKKAKNKRQAQREQERIKQQIAEAKAAKKKQEQALEQERKNAEAKARQAVAAKAAAPTPTPAPPTPTPAPTKPRGIQENQFVSVTEVDTRPVVLRQEPVVWPHSAVRSRRHGVIILSVTVNARGQVTDVKILRADEKGFGIPEAAVAAARRYIFKPATKDGIKVKSTATIAIPFAFKPQP